MPEELRALVVTTALAPDQLHTWQQASELDDVDLHLAGALVSDVSESYLAELKVPDWGTTHVLEPSGWVGRGRLWWNLEGLEALVGRIRPDVVHVHSEAWGRLVAQALGTDAPVIAHGAENVSLDHGGKVEARLRRAMTTRNATRLAGYASWNTAGVELLRANGLRPGTPTAVAPAIVPDPAPFLAAERTRGHDGPMRVGYLGRFVPEKGVQWLIDAMDGLPGVELLLVGSGSYEPDLRRLAARRDVSIEWRPSVAPEEVAGVYADLDVVAVPSVERPGWAEQFGRVVCEAMLTGVPVISSDSGSLPEVVGPAGLLVPELDRRALRTAIECLATNPAERDRLSREGRAWALAELGPAPAARRLGALWQDVAAA